MATEVKNIPLPAAFETTVRTSAPLVPTAGDMPEAFRDLIDTVSTLAHASLDAVDSNAAVSNAAVRSTIDQLISDANRAAERDQFDDQHDDDEENEDEEEDEDEEDDEEEEEEEEEEDGGESDVELDDESDEDLENGEPEHNDNAATDSSEGILAAAAAGTTEYSLRILEATCINANAMLTFASELLRAKSLSEMVVLSAGHARKHLEAVAAQTKQLAVAAEKMTPKNPTATELDK